MTECLLFDPATKEVTQGSEDFISQWIANPELKIWVRITGPLSDDNNWLLQRNFNIHPLAIQDATRDRHPPKIEEFDDHTFLIFKTLTETATDTKFSTLQSILFVGDRFLVTRSSQPCKVIEGLWKSEQTKPTRFIDGPDALAARLIRLHIDRYLEILFQLEAKLEALESSILESVDDSVLAVVTGYKANLKRLRRIFLYHEKVLRDLRSLVFPGFKANCKHELTDIYEQQERASSLTLLYYELSTDLIDGYLSLSSHRLNQIMKVLTIVTVVFVPLGFLAGIYGMNFENIPELNSRNGYFILLGIMATIATTLLLSFRKRGWL